MVVYETQDSDFADSAIEALKEANIACYRTGGSLHLGQSDPTVCIHVSNGADFRRANQILIRQGLRLSVRYTTDIRALASVNTEIFDAQHATIVPGFNDSHNHALGNELLYEVLVVNPYEVEFVSIVLIIDKLRRRAAITPADTWVEGYFYDDTKSKDKRALTVHDLDLLSKELPVAAIHRGGHTAFYNSKAFKMAGISKSTPNPPGGTYDRDSNGSRTLVTSGSSHYRPSAAPHMFSAQCSDSLDHSGTTVINRVGNRIGVLLPRSYAFPVALPALHKNLGLGWQRC